MKLIVLLSLTWMIPNAAESLQCFQGRSPGELQPCSDADDWCATNAHSETFQGKTNKVVSKSCLLPSLCAAHSQTLSVSLGDVSVVSTLHCCNTDGCNRQDFPYADHGERNGLKCLTCREFGPSHYACNSTVECVGIQDRCIDVNVTDHGRDQLQVGCASSNICELASQPKLRLDIAAHYKVIVTPRVKGASFCSSARDVSSSVFPLNSVKLALVLLMLLCLIAVVLYFWIK